MIIKTCIGSQFNQDLCFSSKNNQAWVQKLDTFTT